MTMTTGAITWFNGVIIFSPMLYKLVARLSATCYMARKDDPQNITYLKPDSVRITCWLILTLTLNTYTNTTI